MNELFSGLIVWRLAIFRLALFTFVAGATAYTTTMSGLEWDALNPTQKFLTVLGVLIVMANTIIAFLDRTIEKMGSTLPSPKPNDPSI